MECFTIIQVHLGHEVNYIKRAQWLVILATVHGQQYHNNGGASGAWVQNQEGCIWWWTKAPAPHKLIAWVHWARAATPVQHSHDPESNESLALLLPGASGDSDSLPRAPAGLQHMYNLPGGGGSSFFTQAPTLISGCRKGPLFFPCGPRVLLCCCYSTAGHCDRKTLLPFLYTDT